MPGTRIQSVPSSTGADPLERERARRPERPPLFCFSGIDGSGKSTQVRILVDRLRAEGWDVAHVRSDGVPYVSRPLVQLAKRILRRKARVSRPVGGVLASPDAPDEFTRYLEATNAMLRNHRILRRGWTDVSLVEHAVEASLVVGPQLLRRRVVVCDRYLFRSIVNLGVLLDLHPDELLRLLKHPALRFVPRPSIYFLIDVPAEVGMSRKDDVPSIEYLRRRVPYYRALADSAGMTVIDGTQPVADMAEQIWAVVRAVLTPDHEG